MSQSHDTFLIRANEFHFKQFKCGFDSAFARIWNGADAISINSRRVFFNCVYVCTFLDEQRCFRAWSLDLMWF